MTGLRVYPAAKKMRALLLLPVQTNQRQGADGLREVLPVLRLVLMLLVRSKGAGQGGPRKKKKR
jgi:hypothetical protein